MIDLIHGQIMARYVADHITLELVTAHTFGIKRIDADYFSGE